MVDREFELGICAEWNWRKLSEQDSGRKVWVEKLVHIKQDGPASVLMQPRTPKLSGTCKCTVSKPHPKPKRCSLKVLRSESLAAQIPKSRSAQDVFWRPTWDTLGPLQEPSALGGVDARVPAISEYEEFASWSHVGLKCGRVPL